IFSATNIDRLLELHSDDVWRASRKVNYFLTCFNSNKPISKKLFKHTKLVTFNNDYQESLWRKKFQTNTLVVPYGVNDWSLDSNLRLPNEMKVLWMGAIRTISVLKKIFKFAELNP